MLVPQTRSLGDDRRFQVVVVNSGRREADGYRDNGTYVGWRVSGPVPTVSTSRLRRTGRLSAGFAVVVVLAVGATIYTNSRGTEQVVNDAGALQAAEATIGASDIHLKSLSQVALLTTDASLGLAEPSIVAAAIAEAEASEKRHLAAASRLAESANTIIPLEAMTDATEDLLDAAADGDAAETSRILIEKAAPAHEHLMAVVIAERDELVDRVTAAGESSGRWSRVAGFLTAFLVPLIAMAAYRQVVQRQLRLAKVQLEARIDAEHQVTLAKDHFIADISHELRTPLTSIYGFSEVLLDGDHRDPDAVRDLVTLINRESGELARMVEDLLVAARDPESELALELAANPIIEVIEDTTQSYRRSGHEIDVVAEEALVLCDHLRLRQIVRNLLSNSLRYGGDRVRLVGKRDGDNYVLEVRDNGAGVPREMVPRLFTRFVHADGSALTSGSVGLGLAVAARLARAMGGDLDYTRDGDWTVFSISIPRAQADVPPVGWPRGVRASA